MPRYIAFLRAINVGGRHTVKMDFLRHLFESLGFSNVETFIASGNVVFESEASEAKVKGELEKRLQAYAGKPMGVVVRTAAEMVAVVKANPFPKASPSQAVTIFLDQPPPADALKHAVGVNDEKMRLGKREIFVHFPSGQGRSKLRIPAAKTGTARNMNTIAKLAELAAKVGAK